MTSFMRFLFLTIAATTKLEWQCVRMVHLFLKILEDFSAARLFAECSSDIIFLISCRLLFFFSLVIALCSTTAVGLAASNFLHSLSNSMPNLLFAEKESRCFMDSTAIVVALWTCRLLRR